MAQTSWLRWPNLRDNRDVYMALTAPVVLTFVATTLWNWTHSALFDSYGQARIYRAPQPHSSTDHKHQEDEIDHPYPPDALPGGRDITTLQGTIRAYEWGPPSGQKVLFVHGISTPCIALAKLAEGLVQRAGCRVLLYDLFGRGYSDSPDPEVHRQDSALFAAQILAVLASSELHWRRFALVGYSLGGGVAAAFASCHPQLVESLVLIAPGGIIRPERISLGSKFLYSGILPQGIAQRLVADRLRGVGFPTVTLPQGGSAAVVEAAPEDVAEGYHHAANSEAHIFPGRRSVSPSVVVAWQVDRHPGFVPAFISCMQHGPIHDGHRLWRKIGKRCEDRRRQGIQTWGGHSTGLREGKVLVLLGRQDLVILADETAEDAAAVLGGENVNVLKLDGGHDLPITRSEACIDAILDFWGAGEA